MNQSTTSAPAPLRRAILDTARRVVITDGYQGLSMRRIARRIGYSATSIYLHFENKDALLHALIDEGMERLYRTLREASRAELDSSQRLRAVCDAYVTFGLENREYYEIMFMLRADYVARFPMDKYRRARRNLEIISDALGGARSRDNESSLADAHVVWAVLHGAVSLMIAQRVDASLDSDSFVRSIIDRLLDGFGGGQES